MLRDKFHVTNCFLTKKTTNQRNGSCYQHQENESTDNRKTFVATIGAFSLGSLLLWTQSESIITAQYGQGISLHQPLRIIRFIHQEHVQAIVVFPFVISVIHSISPCMCFKLGVPQQYHSPSCACLLSPVLCGSIVALKKCSGVQILKRPEYKI